ncbi:MAG TPA: hypothetical protein PK530_14405, partial [Anaerolineales bacterium]|nr:hypothetical protein [Anaerolineales bacterium]
APAPLLPAFKVAPPVMRQIMLVLTPLAQANPVAALALADALWQKPVLEMRQIAIRLLGLLPADDPAPLLARAQTWATPKEEEHILDEFFETGLACASGVSTSMIWRMTGGATLNAGRSGAGAPV